MENINSKILSFEEWISNKNGETSEMPGTEIEPTNNEPAPAEEPIAGEEEDKNLSVNMMDSEPTAEVEIEDTETDSADKAETEDNA